MCQSPIQAALRPAMWLPGVRNLHSHKEIWYIPDATPDICLDKAIAAIDELGQSEKMHINKVRRNRYFIQIFSFTEAEWLDVVEIEFQPGQDKGTVAKAKSFSTGLLPTCVPLACIFNMIFFFVPFWDNGFNKARLERIHAKMDLQINVGKT